MNALYADREGTITDFFGGVADAQAGRVRFIGDPEKRIVEDALRILRFFRFHAWYGCGALDSEGLAACTRLAGMIDRLSGERLQIEIFKTLRAPAAAPVWQAMIDAGVMAHAAPALTRVDDLSRLVAIEGELGMAADPLRRLAALTGPLSSESVDALKKRLRLSNRNESHLLSLDRVEDRMPLISSHAFGQAIYGLRADWVWDAAILAHVRSGKPEMAALAALCRFIADWVQPKFPLSGADLQSAGIVPGPDLGRLLTDLERWWVAADFKPDRAACLARLKCI
jgi:poly(A) polymerase